MTKTSAGILMYRRRQGIVEVLLAHMGGPYWAKKDLGAWSIPKGEYSPGEDPLAAARREFEEETGVSVSGEFTALIPIKQAGGKIVQIWALEGDCDASAIRSNTFMMEWPPRSGRQQSFPEVDRAEWFALDIAKEKVTKGQRGFIEQLGRFLQQKENSF
jgi:predicted NUDIX family NTP pyrophosphohydrolase